MRGVANQRHLVRLIDITGTAKHGKRREHRQGNMTEQIVPIGFMPSYTTS